MSHPSNNWMGYVSQHELFMLNDRLWQEAVTVLQMAKLRLGRAREMLPKHIANPQLSRGTNVTGSEMATSFLNST